MNLEKVKLKLALFLLRKYFSKYKIKVTKPYIYTCLEGKMCEELLTLTYFYYKKSNRYWRIDYVD